MRNKTLILKKYPLGIPVAGKDIVIEDRPFDQNAPPPKGGLLVKVLWASFDPFMRGLMRMFKHKYYTDTYKLDGPVLAWTIVNVVKSDARGFSPGDTIAAYTPIAEFAYIGVKSDSSANTCQTDDSHPNSLEPSGPDGADRPPADLLAPHKINNPMNLELCYFLGPLGIVGLTAYYSLYKIGEPKAGETILVSSAAGAVGQVVGQLAKRLGLYVIGSVGTDEKVEFVTQELGFDAAFNYKKEKPGDALPRLAPNEIDIYYDNVGGEHLEAALNNMKIYGRIIGSGMVRALLFFSITPMIYCFLLPLDFYFHFIFIFYLSLSFSHLILLLFLFLLWVGERM